MKPAAPVTRIVIRVALLCCSSAAEFTEIFQAEANQEADALGDVAIGLESVVDREQDRETFVAIEQADAADARFLPYQVVGVGGVSRPELVECDHAARRNLLGAGRADVEHRLGEMQIADAHRAAWADIERRGKLIPV